MNQCKRDQRQAGIAARRAMNAAAHQTADAVICKAILDSEAYRSASSILLYYAAGGEVDLSEVAQRAREDGKRVAWPVCLPEHRMVAAEPENDAAWETGQYGIRAPILSRSQIIPPEELSLVLVPCTAFDAQCRRVGMGGGYYDRYLPQCAHALCWGVAYECQRVECAVIEAHDRQMDAYISERRIYMETMTKWSCEEFLATLASKAPVPGGGGASAMTAALGIALGNMVGSLTTGKKKYAAVEEDIQALNAKAEILRKELVDLVQADAVVFEPLSKAYGLPKATEEEKAHKAEVMEAALKAACEVPLEILRKTGEAVKLIAEYAAKGSALAISDAGVGAAFCRAALEGAALNVYINTKSMTDRVHAGACNAETAALLAEYVPMAEKIYSEVSARLMK